MRHRYSLLATAFALLITPSAHAVTLADVRGVSAQGEPLSLLVQLTELGNVPASDITITLASPEAFARLGVPLPDQPVTLKSEVIADGSNAKARITTGWTPKDSVANLVLQISWSGGLLVKPASIALRPADAVIPAAEAPLIQPAQAEAPVVSASETLPVPPAAVVDAPKPVPEATPPATADSAAIATAASVSQPRVAAGAKPPRLKSAQQKAKETRALEAIKQELLQDTPAPAPIQSGDTLTVAAGDSLTTLAKRWAADQLSLAQRQQLLAEANTTAFSAGDINRLRTGQTVSVPAIPVQDVPTESAARAWLIQHALQGRTLTARAPRPPANLTQPAKAVTEPPAETPAEKAVVLSVVASEAKASGDSAKGGAGADPAQAALSREKSRLQGQLKQLTQETDAQTQQLQVIDERIAALEQVPAVAEAAQPATAAPVPAAPATEVPAASPAADAAPTDLAAVIASRPAWDQFSMLLILSLVLLFLLLSLISGITSRRKPGATPPVDAADAPDAAPPVATEVDAEAEETEYDFLSDTEAVAMQTRLDLASAYLEMGDRAAAEALLTVVREGGTPAQRQRAADLLTG